MDERGEGGRRCDARQFGQIGKALYAMVLQGLRGRGRMRATLECNIVIGLSASANADQLAVMGHGLSPCAKFG
jgi:hypothetical protein